VTATLLAVAFVAAWSLLGPPLVIWVHDLPEFTEGDDT